MKATPSHLNNFNESVKKYFPVIFKNIFQIDCTELINIISLRTVVEQRPYTPSITSNKYRSLTLLIYERFNFFHKLCSL